MNEYIVRSASLNIKTTTAQAEAIYEQVCMSCVQFSLCRPSIRVSEPSMEEAVVVGPHEVFRPIVNGNFAQSGRPCVLEWEAYSGNLVPEEEMQEIIGEMPELVALNARLSQLVTDTFIELGIDPITDEMENVLLDQQIETVVPKFLNQIGGAMVMHDMVLALKDKDGQSRQKVCRLRYIGNTLEVK
jgi:hypothetical protein